MAQKRTCYMCGEKYSYCPTCSEDKSKPAWMATFHDENCKTIFQTCTKYNMKSITKEEAKEVLSQCDLSNKASFRDSVKKDLKVILDETRRRSQIVRQVPETHEEVKNQE